MDRSDKEVEYAPKGMFPEDDDTYEIDVNEDLDVWNRGSGYTWGASSGGWWATGGSDSTTLSSMWSTNTFDHHSTAQRLLKHKNHNYKQFRKTAYFLNAYLY